MGEANFYYFTCLKQILKSQSILQQSYFVSLVQLKKLSTL